MTDGTQTTVASTTDTASAPATATTTEQAQPILGAAALAGQSADTSVNADTSANKDANKDGQTTDANASQENKEGDATKEAPKGAPEAYSDFKAPEGVQLDADLTGEFKDLAKGLNMPQEAAQKIVDLGTKLQAKLAAQMTDQIKTVHTQWATELRTDKDIGGTKLAENLATAQKGLNTYDQGGRLSDLLAKTGLSNNVEVVRFLHAVGKTVSPDTVVNPDGSGATLGSAKAGPGSLTEAANILYGQPKK